MTVVPHDGLAPCPPADPEPHAPRFSVPPLSCDCHIHVFEGDRYPYAARRGYTPPDAPLSSLLQLHRTLGMERAVLTQASVHGGDNRAVLEGAASDPQRFRAVVALDGSVQDSELRRMHDAGARGIRVNLVDKGGMTFASFDELRAVAERIAPLGWHVEFLVHVDQTPELLDLARALPTDIVVGHLGYTPTERGLDSPGYRQFLELVGEGRCWVKLTGPYRITATSLPPYADVAPFAAALVARRPDRMLWGSDWPHVMCKVPMPNDGDLLDILGDWVPDERTREAILVHNPARLYGFD
jgi:2-pyrone-4,6-dicarboxylate lactonase